MASFNAFIPDLLLREGGYQDLESDRGNYNSHGHLVGTNYGISAPVYESIIGKPPTVADMENLPMWKAKEIYLSRYWNKIRASEITIQEVADIITDHAVHAGPGTAIRMVQRILRDKFNKNIVVDGISGSKTIAAINAVNTSKFYDAYLAARESFYAQSNPLHLQGFLNRLKPFYEAAMRLASKKSSIVFTTVIGLGTLFF